MSNPSDAAAMMVTAKGLRREFGKLVALEGLDLEVRRGEIFGLVGPDGAGKTTTVRLLCGLLDATRGSASVAGYDVARQTMAVKDRIGYMAQRFGLYQDLTVRENMNFYADLFGIVGAEREALSARLLAMTRMEPFTGRQAGRLSGGMKQKLALMCTLLHKPEILFLDEPTNGVDPVSRRDFWAILYQLVGDGLTVFITTAYLDEAERCNRVALLSRGQLITCAPPGKLKRSVEETCYELRCSDGRRARTLLEREPEVLSVEPAGDALHLFASPALGREQIIARLEAAGLTSVALVEIVPSLEDVFIALVRKSEAVAA
jgi:ABC-2 type transport system ATP-binding protein